MREETPDGIIAFAMWEEEDGMAFGKFINVEVEAELHHRAFVKKVWIELNEYIDKMNRRMVDNGDLAIIIEQDMLEWRIGVRKN